MMVTKTLCALALMAAVAAGQVTQFENKKIADIQFTPVQTLDAADLAKALPLHKGEPFHADDVAAAIDGLFATGRFRDIVVEAEPAADGVAVRFVTQLTYFVGGVSVEGSIASPPNRGEIAGAARLSLGAPFQDEDLTRARDAISELLKSNGLNEAEVTPTLSRDESAQQIFITFKVAEHKRAKYDPPVIEGDVKLANNTIVKATGWRVPIIHTWRHVTALQTRTGVQGVLGAYQKQDRLEARVELKSVDYDAKRRRVRPTLDITPGPRVKVKAVEAKVSNRLLQRYVPVFEEHSVDNDLLVEGKRNLSDYFQSQGYYDVDIDVRVLPEQNDLQTIEYVISQGQRYKVASVAIEGNHYFTDDTLRERMYMEPSSFTMRRGRYSEAFQRKDQETIANLYRASGYRDVKVKSLVDKNYRGRPGQIGVTVTIDEGPMWKVERLTLNGVQQTTESQVRPLLSSTSGQPFSEATLALDRDQVLTYYYQRGYLDAKFDTAWVPTATPNHVAVTYTVTEGDQRFVRRVITTGLKTTRQSLVDKNITLKPGEPLSEVEQTEIQKRFYDLGIFARVDTAVQNPDGDTDRKYVLYNFEEANRYTFGLGIGALVGRFGTPSSSNLSAPAGSTGFSPVVSMDVTRLNFLGLGHMVALHGMYSTLEKRGSLSYLLPRFMDVQGRNATFTVLYDNSLNVQTFASKREEASVQLSQKFSKAMTGQFRFAYRRVSVGSVAIPTLLIPQLQQPLKIGILSANLLFDRRDDPADPHRGIYTTLDFGAAGKFFGSQRSFGRALGRNATYYRLTKTIVLARQTQFGVIAPFSPPAGISSQQSVPLPERFFGGGADTLRAVPYNQAGPRDTGAAVAAGGKPSEPTGFPLGGNALLYNNVELRFPLIGANIGGVFFHDMGNIYSSAGNISFRFHQRDMKDFDYTAHAVGFGIRYKTPVGPVRLDLAYSINPPSFIGFKGTAAQLLTCNPNVPPQGVCVGVPQSVSHFQFFFSIGQTF
jgi:outer membrane protein insertion porin family